MISNYFVLLAEWTTMCLYFKNPKKFPSQNFDITKLWRYLHTGSKGKAFSSKYILKTFAVAGDSAGTIWAPSFYKFVKIVDQLLIRDIAEADNTENQLLKEATNFLQTW